MRTLTVGDCDQADRDPGVKGCGEQPAGPGDLVIGVRGDDEQARQRLGTRPGGQGGGAGVEVRARGGRHLGAGEGALAGRLSVGCGIGRGGGLSHGRR